MAERSIHFFIKSENVDSVLNSDPPLSWDKSFLSLGLHFLTCKITSRPSSSPKSPGIFFLRPGQAAKNGLGAWKQEETFGAAARHLDVGPPTPSL